MKFDVIFPDGQDKKAKLDVIRPPAEAERHEAPEPHEGVQNQLGTASIARVGRIEGSEPLPFSGYEVLFDANDAVVALIPHRQDGTFNRANLIKVLNAFNGSK